MCASGIGIRRKVKLVPRCLEVPVLFLSLSAFLTTIVQFNVNCFANYYGASLLFFTKITKIPGGLPGHIDHDLFFLSLRNKTLLNFNSDDADLFSGH